MTDEEAPLAVLDEPVTGPPLEPRLWTNYNRNLEFPISLVASVLAHVAIVFVGIFFLFALPSKNTKPVPVIALDGDDDSGLGMAGKGGVEDPIAMGQAPQPEIEKEQLPNNLPDIKENLEKILNFDEPAADLKIPDSQAAALGALDKTLAEKILGIGQRKGTDGAGSGDGAAGTGNGGFGSDSTKARGLRWVLAFKTTSGQDYLNQIDAMKGVVLVPVPPENKRMLVFKNLKNPKGGGTDYATENDIGELSSQIQFSDMRTKSCEAIQEALGLKFTPSAFWAFFPKTMEEQCARLEVAYNNKRSDQIKETKFQVIFAGGQARLNVISQKLK